MYQSAMFETDIDLDLLYICCPQIYRQFLLSKAKQVLELYEDQFLVGTGSPSLLEVGDALL
jgi:hypothetical protein